MTSKALLLFSLIILVNAADVHAEGEGLPKGLLVEKVSVAADPSQSYAIYLPSSYTKARRYAVLYCFDPGGRGTFPVARFKEAAERYGYLLVGSNNSRNGPGVDVNDIFRKLWDDTHARFSIDDRRVYLAGFSGGARLALLGGYSLKGAIAGVISCSGGFPTRQRSLPPLTFALYGTAGVGDFNNPEMRDLFRAVEGANAATRLAFFEGGHEWPPAEAFNAAVEWLELQAMRAGLREKDAAFVESLFKRVEAAARAAEAAGDLPRAFNEYSGLAKDFRGLRDVSEAERAAARLGKAKEVAEADRRERALEEAQRRRGQQLAAWCNSLLNADERVSAIFELRSAAGELKKALAKGEGDESVLARRLLDSLLIQSFEQGSGALFRKEYAGAAATFALGAELQPDNPRVFYQLARAYALGREKGKALEALRAAVDHGFDGAEALAAADFDSLRDDRRFKEIVEAVTKNQQSKPGN
jgi:dienelactone hydrolase